MRTPGRAVVVGASTLAAGAALATFGFSHGEVRVGGFGLGIVIIGITQIFGLS